MLTADKVADQPFFRGLTEEQVTTLLDCSTERTFDGGETVVRQFDQKTDVMVVLEGKVFIKSFGGETIAELGQGSVVGEMSLVDEGPRSATAVSAGRTRVAVLSSERLKGLFEADSALKAQVMENLARILCGRLRAANVQLDIGR
jgi:CRP/FNR family transcriptional regulator, cyclic AMP receptor protein